MSNYDLFMLLVNNDWASLCGHLFNRRTHRVHRRTLLISTLGDYIKQQRRFRPPPIACLGQLIEVFVELNGYYTRTDCIQYMQEPDVDARKMMGYLFKMCMQAEAYEAVWCHVARIRPNETPKMFLSSVAVLLDFLYRDLAKIVVEYLVGVFYNMTDRERADSDSEERDNWVQMDWDTFFRSLRNPGFTAEDCKREALQYNRTHPPRPAHRDIDPDRRARKQPKKLR